MPQEQDFGVGAASGTAAHEASKPESEVQIALVTLIGEEAGEEEAFVALPGDLNLDDEGFDAEEEEGDLGLLGVSL